MACCDKNVKSLKQVFSRELKPQRHIELPAWGVRIGLINGDLWIPIPENNIIQVINQEAEFVKTICHHNHPRSVIQASNGDIILASVAGLNIIGIDGKLLKCIKSGKFCDISIDGDTFAALDYSRNTISVWELEGDKNQWRQISIFKEINGNIDTLGTVLYFNSTIYCVSDPRSNSVDEYTKYGEFSKQHTQPNADFIYLCAHDNTGGFVTASCINHGLILYKNGRFENLSAFGVQRPIDVVCMDGGESVWILRDGPPCLVKYR